MFGIIPGPSRFSLSRPPLFRNFALHIINIGSRITAHRFLPIILSDVIIRDLNLAGHETRTGLYCFVSHCRCTVYGRGSLVAQNTGEHREKYVCRGFRHVSPTGMKLNVSMRPFVFFFSRRYRDRSRQVCRNDGGIFIPVS